MHEFWTQLVAYLALHQVSLGIWVAAALTLAVYSFLYSDSPVFRVAEHLFIGVSAAYGVVIFLHGPIKEKIYYPTVALTKLVLDHFQVNYHPAVRHVFDFFHASLPDLAQAAAAVPVDFRLLPIPLLLGVLIFGRFFRGLQWLSRYPIAFAVGFGAGATIPLAFQANLLAQTRQTIEPFVKSPEVSMAPADVLGAWVLAAAVLTTLAYFYFSAPHRGWLGRSSRLGVWFLMIAFGVGFGNTVMARVALLIGRMQFLLYDWLPLWTSFHKP